MIRVVSALLLIPIVFAVVWLLPPAATLVLALLAAGLAFREYAALAEALGASVPRAVTAAGVLAACAAVGTGWLPTDVVLLATVVVLGCVAVATWRPGSGVLAALGASGLALLYIGMPLGAIAAVRAAAGREALLLLVVTIIVSDSAQYYTGRAFGRTPLAPAISPKKTREGAFGGVLLGSAVLLVGGLSVFPSAPVVLMAAVAVLVVSAGIAGDLFESLLKRSAGVKDSSGLIPGHGGVLDRIDSWLFAGPVYYLFVRYLTAA